MPISTISSFTSRDERVSPQAPVSSAAAFVQRLLTDGEHPGILRTYVLTLINFIDWLTDTRPSLADACQLSSGDIDAFLSAHTRSFPDVAEPRSERLILGDYLAFARSREGEGEPRV
jgi:hypothetical protein